MYQPLHQGPKQVVFGPSRKSNHVVRRYNAVSKSYFKENIAASIQPAQVLSHKVSTQIPVACFWTAWFKLGEIFNLKCSNFKFCHVVGGCQLTQKVVLAQTAPVATCT